MNWDQIAGKWKRFKGKLRERWGMVTNDDSKRIEGRREQLDGFLQESFGTIKEIAGKKISKFLQSHPEYYATHPHRATQT